PPSNRSMLRKRRVRADTARKTSLKEQRAPQNGPEASRQMRRFVFQIERQSGQGRQIDSEQMGFGGTHALHFDPADRGIHPFATRPRHPSTSGGRHSPARPRITLSKQSSSLLASCRKFGRDDGYSCSR